MTAAEYNTISFPKLGWEFAADSTAFEIFGFPIRWYGILIGIGFLAAVTYCFRRMEKNGVDGDRAFDVVFWGALGAFVGARLYYVLISWDSFRDKPSDIIFGIRSGGLAIYVGIIGAIAVGFLAARIRKVYMPPLLDLAGLGFLIGQSIGRWGNFFNHECFGGNTTLPWGMTSPRIAKHIMAETSAGMEVNPSLPVHPCFLYESLWCALGFLLLRLYFKKKRFDGEVFFMYIGWYGLGRMFIEGLRTDSLMLGNFRVSQVLAVLSVIAAAAVIAVMRRKADVDGYTFYKDTDKFRVLLAESKAKEQAYIEKQNAKKNARKNGEVRASENDNKIIEDTAENEEEEKEDGENH